MQINLPERYMYAFEIIVKKSMSLSWSFEYFESYCLHIVRTFLGPKFTCVPVGFRSFKEA